MSVFVSKIGPAWQQGKPNRLPEPASSSMGGSSWTAPWLQSCPLDMTAVPQQLYHQKQVREGLSSLQEPKET